MSRFATLVSVLATAPLCAQYTNSMTLDTDAGQFATAAGTVDFNSSPKGTVIPPIRWTYRLNSTVRTGSGATARNAMQTLWASANTDNGGGMGMSGLARGTSADKTYTTPSQNQNGAPGAVEFLAKMTGPKNEKGALRLSWQTLFKNNAISKATLDLGDDGTIDWTGVDTKGGVKGEDLLSQFDSNGELIFRVTMEGRMSGASSPFDYSSIYSRLTWKWLIPQSASCTITPYGSGCQGATVSGAAVKFPNHHVITLKLTGGFPNGHVIEAVGTRQFNIPLPGGCSLLSNALVLLVHQTDASGEYSKQYTVGNYKNALAYHQFLPIDLQSSNVVIKATNGLKIECKAAR